MSPISIIAQKHPAESKGFWEAVKEIEPKSVNTATVDNPKHVSAESTSELRVIGCGGLSDFVEKLKRRSSRNDSVAGDPHEKERLQAVENMEGR